MRIAGLTKDQPLSGWAERLGGGQQTHLEDIPAEATVFIDTVQIIYGGPEENRRPALKLSGELRSLRPETGDLSNDIHEVYFRSEVGPRIDGIYTFEQDQLEALVAKGYFAPGFEVPTVIQNIEYVLPVTANVLVLNPEHEGDVPVVWLDVIDRATLALDRQSSGYDLVEYFAAVGQPEATTPETTHAVESAARRDDYLNDIFKDQPLDEPELAGQGWTQEEAGPAQAEAAESDYDRLAREQRERLAREAAEDEAERRESDPIDQFYREHLADADTPRVEPTEPTPAPVAPTTPDVPASEETAQDDGDVAFDDDEDRPSLVRPVELSPEGDSTLSAARARKFERDRRAREVNTAPVPGADRQAGDDSGDRGLE